MDCALQKACTIKQNKDWILKSVYCISRKVDTCNFHKDFKLYNIVSIGQLRVHLCLQNKMLYNLG